MAAQCGISGGQVVHGPFVSSSVYYGYVPTRLQEPPADSRMDVDAEAVCQQYLQVERPRKRGLEPLAAYVPRFKRLREEAVVTNVFSMVQETVSGQKNVDWPRCTMSRYYA